MALQAAVAEIRDVETGRSEIIRTGTSKIWDMGAGVLGFTLVLPVLPPRTPRCNENPPPC